MYSCRCYNLTWCYSSHTLQHCMGHCSKSSTLQSSHWVLWSMHRRKVQNHVWTWRCIPQPEVWIFCLLLPSKTSTSHKLQTRKHYFKILTFQNLQHIKIISKFTTHQIFFQNLQHKKTHDTILLFSCYLICWRWR